MNRYVVQKGQEKGVPSPVNAALTTRMKEIKAGVRPISPDNLDVLLRQCARCSRCGGKPWLDTLDGKLRFATAGRLCIT